MWDVFVVPVVFSNAQLYIREAILGAFAKLRKMTITFVMFLRPFVRMEQFGSHWTDFDKIWYLSFEKSV
jgi:hypothetical protein